MTGPEVGAQRAQRRRSRDAIDGNRAASQAPLTSRRAEILGCLPNRAALVPDTRRSLSVIAAILAGDPDAEIVIDGHTDSRGDPRANLERSQQRAEWVRRHLIRRGIAPERVAARGFGDSAPIADTDTAAGRRDNRRIVFRVKE